jgi:hypothetical protein
MVFRACAGLLALHSILEEADSLVVVHNPVEEDSLAVEHSPVEVEADTLEVDMLEEASAAVQCQIVAARADHHLSYAPLQVAVQMVVLLAPVWVVVVLLVVRVAVPGCSFESPSRVPFIHESDKRHREHTNLHLHEHHSASRTISPRHVCMYSTSQEIT